MKNYIFLLLFPVFLFACKTEMETAYKEVPALRASTIYNGEIVNEYILQHKDSNKVFADSYLKKAVEIEKDDILKAIYYTKRAITINPTLSSYNSLIKLLDKNNDYEEMYKACYFINSSRYLKDASGEMTTRYIFQTPSEDMYYEYLVSVVASKNHLSGEDAFLISNLGFDISSFKQKFFSDKRVNIDMSSEEGKAISLMFMTSEELEAYNSLKSTFKNYLDAAEAHAPVYEISKENIWKFNYDEFNGRFDSDDYFVDGIDDRTSTLYRNYLYETKKNPDFWIDFNLKNFIEINQNVMAMIYAVDSSVTACPFEMRQIYYRLVTYNEKAKIIDSKIIAMQNGNDLKTASFNNGEIKIKMQKRIWKNKYEENDFDNFITAIEDVGEENYEVQPDGKIKEMSTATPAI